MYDNEGTEPPTPTAQLSPLFTLVQQLQQQQQQH
jgi:hypothetical protein